MGTKREAEEILKAIGLRFGVPEIASEAIEDLPLWMTGDGDPVIVAWEIFTGLLEAYEVTEKAFWNGVCRSNLIGFLLPSIRLQDAEDVSQIAAHGAWTSFKSFRPRRQNSWEAWLKMIATRKLNTHLAQLYKEMEHIEWLEGLMIDEMHLNPESLEGHPLNANQEAYEKQNNAVRVVVERWMTGGHTGRAVFAARILATLNNEEDYIGLSGSYMQGEVGVSRETLRKWAREFILEVHNESKS